MAGKFSWDDFPDANDAPAAPTPTPAPTGQGAKFSWDQFPDADEDSTAAPQQPRGVMVYDRPPGPEQEGLLDRVNEDIHNPLLWKGVMLGKGPYATKAIQGDVPMVVPGSALPKLASAMTALQEGQGLGYALGRTALSTTQGAGMSALEDGKDGETFGDKIDRVEHGGKLAGGIQLAAESLPYVGKFAGYMGGKVGTWGSNIAEKIIRNYADRTDEVNKIIKASDGDMTVAADQVRTQLSDGIQKAKRALNGQITQTLQNSSPDATISVQPIIEQLESAKASLNPNYKQSAINEIDEMIQNIQKEANNQGMVTPKSLYETKQYLGENSRGAYNKGGQIFTRSSEAARAAKAAAGEARGIIADEVPEISQADSQLSKLHSIEGRLNKNLIAPGKPDGALLSAGAGLNARNAATLRELENVSGVPVSQMATDLATAKEFAKPSLFPTDTTGKALLRMGVGAGIGYKLDGSDGAMVGGALASPMMVKGVINTANVARKVGAASGISNVAQVIRNNPGASQAVAHLLDRQIQDSNSGIPQPQPAPAPQEVAPPVLGSAGDDNRVPAAAPPLSKQVVWARQGAQNLGLSDPGIQAKLMSDPKARQLLMQASNHAPGSRALQSIKSQLQKGYGVK